MGLRNTVKNFKKWCPQPQANLPKRSHYATPVTVALVSVLIISVSFSLIAAQYFLSKPMPQIPDINTPTENPTPTPTAGSPTNSPTSQPTITPQHSSPTTTPTSEPTPTRNPNPTWHINTVDQQGMVGAYSSFALDSKGRPHISYFDSSNGYLKYASWSGTAWNTQTIDMQTFNGPGKVTATSAGVGVFSSLALDSNNYPHISYKNYTDFNKARTAFNSSLSFGELKYAWWDGNAWSMQTVDSGHVGDYSSIALDSHGYPHISYYDSNTYHDDGRVKYAAWDGTAWNIEIIDSVGNKGAADTSIAIDSENHAHISYYDTKTGNLKYASWTNEGWRTQVVDYAVNVYQNTGAGCPLVLDSNDIPHISYQKGPDGEGYSLQYASLNGTSWNIQTVDSEPERAVGGYSSLALDSKGYPHISYYAGGQMGDLKYAQWNGTAWKVITVDSPDQIGHHLGFYTSLALDSFDNPHISYSDEYNHCLKYASFG